MRRAVAVMAVATLVALAAGCGDDGSQEKFCAQLPDTAAVLDLTRNFDTTDPQVLRERFEEGVAEFRDLEEAAPRELRDNVRTVIEAVEELLEVIERNADDRVALLEELRAEADQFVGAGRAGSEIERYARDECGIDLSRPRPGPGNGTGG